MSFLFAHETLLHYVDVSLGSSLLSVSQIFPLSDDVMNLSNAHLLSGLQGVEW